MSRADVQDEALGGVEEIGEDDGLVRCMCGSVVGEVQAVPSPLLAPGTSKRDQAARRRRRSQASVLRLYTGTLPGSAEGVLLYRHRVSMPRALGENGSIEYPDDLLGSFTEEAAVAQQVLDLHVEGGTSRFLLIPGGPSCAHTPEAIDLEAAGESPRLAAGMEATQGHVTASGLAIELKAIELRVVIGECFVVGPESHSGMATGEPMRLPPSAPRAQRATKVWYRRLPRLPPQTDSSVVAVGVPQQSLEAVAAALDWWVDALPETISLACPIGPGTTPAWRASLLPLPPRSLGLDDW